MFTMRRAVSTVLKLQTLQSQQTVAAKGEGAAGSLGMNDDVGDNGHIADRAKPRDSSVLYVGAEGTIGHVRELWSPPFFEP